MVNPTQVRRLRLLIPNESKITLNRNYSANPIPHQSSKPQGDSTCQLPHLADDVNSAHKKKRHIQGFYRRGKTVQTGSPQPGVSASPRSAGRTPAQVYPHHCAIHRRADTQPSTALRQSSSKTQLSRAPRQYNDNHRGINTRQKITQHDATYENRRLYLVHAKSSGRPQSTQR